MTEPHSPNTAASESADVLADIYLPTLRAVLDTGELRKHLNRELFPQWGSLKDIQSRVLLHHPKTRCTIEFTLQTETGKHELIGKVYAGARFDVYRAMQEISQCGFGPEDEFSIPRPLAFIPELNLLLQEKVPGQSVTEMFLASDESKRAEGAERCARWLAQFQSRAPRSGPVFRLTPAVMERWRRRLVKRAEPLKDKADLLFQRLELVASGLVSESTSACHGSYCHKQIIVTKTSTVTFDWDNHCVANPSHDVARFISALQRLAVHLLGSLKALDAAIQVFSDTYMAASGFEVANELPFYKAAHCLNLARFHLKLGPGGIEKTEVLLDEGLRVLAEEM